MNTALEVGGSGPASQAAALRKQGSSAVIVWISWPGTRTAPHHGLGKVPAANEYRDMAISL